jgi:3-hydroxyisobutyrate dehydrogenase
MKQKVAFLGLGVMGSPMTINLFNQGFEVTAWNRTGDRSGVKMVKSAGVKVVTSIAEAVQDADYIFTCVGDVPDVEEVILGDQGVINYAQPNALIVDFSTIGAPTAQKIASVLNQHHLRFLDAPISGGDIGAKNGTLTIMVGGKESDFQEVKPLLEAMGKNIILCGEVGSGQGVKMCNQAICAIYMIALCEGIKMAQTQGIDPNLMIQVCNTGAGSSWALANLAPKIVESDYNPGFMIKHILKDLRLVKETLASEGKTLAGVELANSLFAQVAHLENGLDQGTQAMFRAYE